MCTFRISEKWIFPMLLPKHSGCFQCICGLFCVSFCVRSGSQRVLHLFPLWKKIIALGVRPPLTRAAVCPALHPRWIILQREWVSVCPEASNWEIVFQAVPHPTTETRGRSWRSCHFFHINDFWSHHGFWSNTENNVKCLNCFP